MLGEEPTCKTAQIAHNSPIMAMVYGPYDNGPLVTVDACSVCRIWVWASGLVCSQTVESPRNSLGCSVSVCVEPQFGLYSTLATPRLSYGAETQHRSVGRCEILVQRTCVSRPRTAVSRAWWSTSLTQGGIVNAIAKNNST